MSGPVQEMLDQYGPQDSKLLSLDSALKDAVQMVKVSDQRITYLRKMHALLLLKRYWSASCTTIICHVIHAWPYGRATLLLRVYGSLRKAAHGQVAG